MLLSVFVSGDNRAELSWLIPVPSRHKDIVQHEQLVKVFMAPPNSARATPQQQLPGMSGLDFSSNSSRPSA